jgi:AcrR family transcriptional regulator
MENADQPPGSQPNNQAGGTVNGQLNSPVNGQANGRERVLDAAAARFVEQGYAATTLRQIAGDIGIQAGSIYHHFSSKEELFAAVLDEGIVVMQKAFDQADGTLIGHVRAHLGALFEHGPYTAAHVTAFFTAPPNVRTATVVVRDAYESRWQLLLADLLPHLGDKEVRLRRLILFGAMNTTIEWFDRSGNVTLDELAETIASQFLEGVGS